MEYTFVLLSGGIGSRMNNSTPKQYMLIAGKPMIVHILEKIDCINAIKEIVVVCEDEYRTSIGYMLEQYQIRKTVKYASAGGSRQESVLSGLRLVQTNNVIIHEAARPFVQVKEYQELIDEPCENVMIGMDIPFTVIKGQDYVEGLLTRSELVNVQLPQKYNTELLLKAHLKAREEGKTYTEDASLLYGFDPEIKIKIIKGKDYNIKITTQLDMVISEIIYEKYFSKR